jgi:hypothetical protein
MRIQIPGRRKIEINITLGICNQRTRDGGLYIDIFCEIIKGTQQQLRGLTCDACS